jgi:hypothetical protein
MNQGRHSRPVPLAVVISDIVEQARQLRRPCSRDLHAFYKGKVGLMGALRVLTRKSEMGR